MNKSTTVRWVLDIAVGVCIIYTGWSFRQFTKLNENDIIQRTQIEAMQSSVGQLTDTIDKLTASIEKQNKQLQALVMLSTFRVDPWSGEMMVAFSDIFCGLLMEQDIHIDEPGTPFIREIQRTYAEELIPKGLLE